LHISESGLKDPLFFLPDNSRDRKLWVKNLQLLGRAKVATSARLTLRNNFCDFKGKT
jgi:hypothetical protein